MKRNLTLILFMVILAALAFAEKNSNFPAVGYELGEIGDDLTMGLRITSPFTFDGHAAARISGNAAWNRSDWNPYAVFRAGVIGTAGMINNFARLYGEGGLVLLWNEEGANSLNWGGYGHFGFEFFTKEDSPVSYFIELGTTGISINRLNGFNLRTGLEIYL